MGEASRRKDLVEDVRRKIGEQAAAAVAGLEAQVKQLQLQHQAFVFEIEGLRREVSAAKAAPAELRRDVRSFHGDLAMKAENLENLALRHAELRREFDVLRRVCDTDWDTRAAHTSLRQRLRLLFRGA